jgi:MraZ protein
MFLGEYRHSVDQKGRLTLPARYRQLLENGGYITQGLDRNLMVWQKDSFEKLGAQVTRKSITDQTVREFSRVFFGEAERIEWDGSGRILIPQFLRDRHQMNGEVVIKGSGDYFEIWVPSEWSKQMANLEKVQDNAQYFAKLDLFANES